MESSQLCEEPHPEPRVSQWSNADRTLHDAEIIAGHPVDLAQNRRGEDPSLVRFRADPMLLGPRPGVIDTFQVVEREHERTFELVSVAEERMLRDESRRRVADPLELFAQHHPVECERSEEVKSPRRQPFSLSDLRLGEGNVRGLA